MPLANYLSEKHRVLPRRVGRAASPVLVPRSIELDPEPRTPARPWAPTLRMLPELPATPVEPLLRQGKGIRQVLASLALQHP